MTNDEMISKFAKLLPNLYEEGTFQGVILVWNIFTSFLVEYFFYIISTLILLLVISYIYAKVTGKWGNLGKFLNNIFTLLFILIVGLIFGPEIFITNLFNFFSTIILYPICYLLTGKILRRLNFI